MTYNKSILFATTLNNVRNHHAAVLVSKYSFANHCSVQLLADQRCRWLTYRCHLWRLMRKRKRKKKLNSNSQYCHKKKTDSFSTNFLHYFKKTTQPVIKKSRSNVLLLSERCNDCKVIKLFKKRRKL